MLRGLKQAVEANAPLAIRAVGPSVCTSEPNSFVAEVRVYEFL
jgi:hypothetical protein